MIFGSSLLTRKGKKMKTDFDLAMAVIKDEVKELLDIYYDKMKNRFIEIIEEAGKELHLDREITEELVIRIKWTDSPKI